MKNRAPKLKFISYHQAPLYKGDYRIKVSQTYGSTESGIGAIRMDTTGYALMLQEKATLKTLPADLKATLLVAQLPDGLFFRVFDRAGGILRDTPEVELSAWETERAALTAELAPMWKKPPTGAAQSALVDKITTMLGVRFESDRSFTVGGERYALNPQEVMAVFPPEGSAGDHANALPHIILRRTTLPWERRALTHRPSDQAQPAPWMAILSFDDDAPDAPVLKTITLGIHKDKGGSFAPDCLYQDTELSYVHEHADNAEGGEAADWPVKVIDLSPKLALDMLPRFDELPYLAHVRQPEAMDGHDLGGEQAVVIGSRLPTRGKQTVAYLVSLEHRFHEGKFWIDQQSAKKDGSEKKVRLVVLKTWRFRCLDEASYLITPKIAKAVTDADTKKLLNEKHNELVGKEIVGEPDFRAALDGLTEPQIKPLLTAARYKKLSFKSLLMELKGDALRLPATALHLPADATAQSLLDQSLVLLPHRLRNGGQSAAFYRGPLTGGGVISGGDVPVTRAADHLLRQERTAGAIDTSYAAAWQLGRMKMLSSKTVALALFNWKRVHAQWVKSAAKRLAHLPFNRLPGQLDVPETLRNWLYDTALLKGLPFGYLVPDPAMLPQESIRYFQVDPVWVEAMLDGAFSIGRVNSADQSRDAELAGLEGPPRELARETSNWAKLPTGAVEGVLVRSEVVAGWPHLQADAICFVAARHAAEVDTDLEILQSDLSNGEMGKTFPLSEPCYRALVGCGLTMPDLEHCHVRVTGLSLQDQPETWHIVETLADSERTLCHIESRNVYEDGWTLDVTLPALRIEHLAKGVLLCLFQGRIDALDLHLKPEAVHFGVGEPDPRHPHINYKELRHFDGIENPDAIIEKVPWKNTRGAKRTDGVLNIRTLARSKTSPSGMRRALGHPAPLRPAEFSLQMVEGVDRVRYVRAGAEYEEE